MSKKIKLDKDFYRIVGEIVVTYSKAEFYCSLIVNIITGTKDGNRIYVDTNLNAEKKIKKFKDTVRKLTHSNKTTFLAELGKMNQCRIDRNSIVHSIWIRLPRHKKSHGFGVNRNYLSPSYTDSNDAGGLLDRLKLVSEELVIILGNVTLASNSIKGHTKK